MVTHSHDIEIKLFFQQLKDFQESSLVLAEWTMQCRSNRLPSNFV